MRLSTGCCQTSPGCSPTPTTHRVIAAVELNILHRYGERRDSYWAGRYASVFDRAEALGLELIGPQAPNGRRAQPRPAELPPQSQDVPTYRRFRHDPDSASRQIDFAFATASLADRVTVRARNRDDEWGPSDHCRIEIALWACALEEVFLLLAPLGVDFIRDFGEVAEVALGGVDPHSQLDELEVLV